MLEINRLCDSSLWKYVDGSNMVADIGTRNGVKISEVTENSVGIKGLSWMSAEAKENFPVLTVEQIKLNKAEFQNLKKEQLDGDISENLNTSVSKNSYAHVSKYVSSRVKARYEFSKYIIDPNKFRYHKVVRILSFVLKYIKKIGKNI